MIHQCIVLRDRQTSRNLNTSLASILKTADEINLPDRQTENSNHIKKILEVPSMIPLIGLYLYPYYIQTRT